MLSRRVLFLASLLVFLLGLLLWQTRSLESKFAQVLSTSAHTQYWLLLHRRANVEYLYRGVPGDDTRSDLLKTFTVKSGIPGERPTPLPELVGRNYWIITKKEAQPLPDFPETAPYFLTLDIPVGETEPFGPTPYEECNGQCNWIVPGAFGLHGSGGDPSKLSAENPGSSGCVRHFDEDIAYLYDLLDPATQEIRYYVEDM